MTKPSAGWLLTRGDDMAGLSSVFMRPRALGPNPFGTNTSRSQDFIRTTGVYKVLIVGGGGGGGGNSQNTLYYGEAGQTAYPSFATVQVRDGITIHVGAGGYAGSTGSRGGNGGQTSLVGATTVTASGGAGGAGSGTSLDYSSSFISQYRLMSGGTRPNLEIRLLAIHAQGYERINAGRGGGSGGSGGSGGILYNLLFRVG